MVDKPKTDECKRLQVRSIGISLDSPLDFHVATAINKNLHDGCKNIPGACTCTHSEHLLLQKFPNPDIIYLTHSPCLSCAELIHRHGVRLVVFQNTYRLTDGLDYLQKHGVSLVYLPKEELDGFDSE